MARDKKGGWYNPGDAGIVVSIEKRDGNTTRLQLGDVMRSPRNGWDDKRPITYIDLEGVAFQKAEIDDRALAKIGSLILARLASTNS